MGLRDISNMVKAQLLNIATERLASELVDQLARDRFNAMDAVSAFRGVEIMLKELDQLFNQIDASIELEAKSGKANTGDIR
jgi:hypothetical protein